MDNRLIGDYRNSASFYSTQSGLNTALAGEDEVRRSRIMHLPSYSRGDLSGKLDFVVVFQTLEIERLSTEIEALRVMLRDAERQISNSLSYEVQIRELTENCHHLEMQQAEYQHQVEQMSLACNALYGQLAYVQRQREKQTEANALKTGQLSTISQQLTQRAQALENKLKSSYESERESQRRTKAAAEEVARLTQNLAESEEKLLRKGKQFARLQQDLNKWQESDRQQRERIVNVLKEQKRQLAQVVAQQRAQAATTGNIKREIQTSKRENDFLKQEIENLKDQFLRLRTQNKSTLTALNQSQLTNQQLTRQLKAISTDIAKEKERSQQISNFAGELRAEIEAKGKDLQLIRRSFNNYEREMLSRNDREAQLIKRVEIVDRTLAQNNGLQDQIMNLNGRLLQMQGQKNLKTQEVAELVLDNKELQQKIQRLEAVCQKHESQLRSLEETLQRHKQQMEGEKRRLANDYQKMLQKEGEEKSKLSNQVKQMERDIQMIKQEGLVKQELRNQVRVLAENVKRQEANIQSILARLQTYQTIFKKMREKYLETSEFGKANTLLRQQLDASLALNDRMIEKIGAYQQELETLVDQNWRLTDKIRQESFKDDYSTASSAKTTTSLRYSYVQQVKPFETLPESTSTTQQGRSFIEATRTKEPLSLTRDNSFGTTSLAWRR